MSNIFNVKKLLVLVTCVCFFWGAPSRIFFAQNTNANSQTRPYLDEAVEILCVNGDWKSEEFTAKLKYILDQKSNSAEVQTAKLLYVWHLQALDPGDMREIANLKEAGKLSHEIIATNPDSWQASMAQFALAAAAGNRQQYAEQISLAKEALKKIDFKRLDGTKDENFLKIAKLLSLNSNSMKDALNLLICSGEANSGNIEEAERILLTLKKQEFREAAAEEIKSQKRKRGMVDTVSDKKSANATISSQQTTTMPVQASNPEVVQMSPVRVEPTKSAIPWIVGGLLLLVVIVGALLRLPPAK